MLSLRASAAGAGIQLDPFQDRSPAAASRHDRASELLDEWDCVDELVDEESWSQELVV